MTQKVGWENITLHIHFWSTFPCYKQQKQNKPFLVYCFCLTKIWSTAPLQSFTHTIARLAFGKNSFLCSYLAISFQLKCLAIFKSLLTQKKITFLLPPKLLRWPFLLVFQVNLIFNTNLYNHNHSIFRWGQTFKWSQKCRMIAYFGKTSEVSLQACMYRETPYPPQMPNQSCMDFKIQGILM